MFDPLDDEKPKDGMSKEEYLSQLKEQRATEKKKSVFAWIAAFIIMAGFGYGAFTYVQNHFLGIRMAQWEEKISSILGNDPCAGMPIRKEEEIIADISACKKRVSDAETRVRKGGTISADNRGKVTTSVNMQDLTDFNKINDEEMEKIDLLELELERYRFVVNHDDDAGN